MQIWGVFPLIKLQNNKKQQLNNRKWDVELGHLSDDFF